MGKQRVLKFSFNITKTFGFEPAHKCAGCIGLLENHGFSMSQKILDFLNGESE